MKTNYIDNRDCFETMRDIGSQEVGVILTSPFYNTNRRSARGLTLQTAQLQPGKYAHVRYDVHLDDMTNDEYAEYTQKLFTEFDRILAPNGCILYNINYGNANTEGLFRAVNAIICGTNFTIADVIVWKKKCAMPNNCSPNRLTRIWEFVFVFCRKTEEKTFICNKKSTSRRGTGQVMYETIYNFIEAKNNDGPCPYNKATYSSELCEKLLNLYPPSNGVVYDPFMGSGTTAVACARLGLSYLGSEISADQVEYARKRVAAELEKVEEDVAWMM